MYTHHNLLRKREEFTVNIRSHHVKKCIKQRRLELVNKLNQMQNQNNSFGARNSKKEFKKEQIFTITDFFNKIKIMDRNILNLEQGYSGILKIIKDLIQPNEIYHRKILDELFECTYHFDEIKSSYKNSYALLNLLNLNYLNNNQINLLQEIVDFSYQQPTEEFIIFLINLLNYENHPLFHSYITECNLQQLIKVMIIANVNITQMLLLFFINLTCLNDEYIYIIVRYNILSKFLFTLEFGTKKQKIYTLTLIYNILTVKELSKEIKEHGVFSKILQKMENLKNQSFQIQQQLCHCFIQYVLTIKSESDFKHFDENRCFSHLIKILSDQFFNKDLKEATMHAIYHLILESKHQNYKQIKDNPYFIALQVQNGIEQFQKLYDSDPQHFQIAQVILNLFTPDEETF